MSIHFEHSLDVARGPERAFAVLDDFSATPKWLTRCKSIEKLSAGPNTVGTKLRYSYREAGHSGSMEGVIVHRTPNERLTLRCSDELLEVLIDFRMSKTDGGARLVHAIDVTPKSLLTRLFTPVIRNELPKQTIFALERLRTLLESTP